MNRPATGRLHIRRCVRCLRLRFRISRNGHRQLRCRKHICFTKLAALELTPPLEQLVRVHSMSPRHLSHTRSGFQRQLHDPQLLRNRSPPSTTAPNSDSFCIHAAILNPGYAHLLVGTFGRLPYRLGTGRRLRLILCTTPHRLCQPGSGCQLLRLGGFQASDCRRALRFRLRAQVRGDLLSHTLDLPRIKEFLMMSVDISRD